mgnify:CR=1 FL=1
MAKKVLKFGGTSVGSIKRILHAAKIIKKEHNNGNKLIVVVSAMSGTTNNLVAQQCLQMEHLLFDNECMLVSEFDRKANK